MRTYSTWPRSAGVRSMSLSKRRCEHNHQAARERTALVILSTTPKHRRCSMSTWSPVSLRRTSRERLDCCSSERSRCHGASREHGRRPMQPHPLCRRLYPVRSTFRTNMVAYRTMEDKQEGGIEDEEGGDDDRQHLLHSGGEADRPGFFASGDRSFGYHTLGLHTAVTVAGWGSSRCCGGSASG